MGVRRVLKIGGSRCSCCDIQPSTPQAVTIPEASLPVARVKNYHGSRSYSQKLVSNRNIRAHLKHTEATQRGRRGAADFVAGVRPGRSRRGSPRISAAASARAAERRPGAGRTSPRPPICTSARTSPQRGPFSWAKHVGATWMDEPNPAFRMDETQKGARACVFQVSLFRVLFA